MNKFLPLLIALLVFSVHASANPVVDKAAVIAISAELSAAVEKKDLSVFRKYLYPGTRIVVDMDPDSEAGQMELGYDDYMAVTEMAFGAIESAEISEELLSVSVDEKANKATIEQKTTATMQVMGMKMRDVSINKTTFGVVDGQIKVLFAEDQLISSEPVQ